MTRVVPLLLAVCLATIWAAVAENWLDLRVAGRHAAAHGYGFDLGEPDDAAPPHDWLGPMPVTSPSARSCPVSEDVGIIDRPPGLLRGRLLYLDTCSGSADRVFVVDAANCAIVWTSPVQDGPSRIRGDGCCSTASRRSTSARGTAGPTGSRPWRGRRSIGAPRLAAGPTPRPDRLLPPLPSHGEIGAWKPRTVRPPSSP